MIKIKQIQIDKKLLFFGAFFLSLIAGSIMLFYKASSVAEPVAANSIEALYNELPPQAKNLYFQQSEELTKEVPERLVELDQLTIGCFGTDTIMQMSTEDTNLGGQCCGALKDIKEYDLQLEALHEFIEKNGGTDLIPQDPYDISVVDAQKLISFETSTTLTPQQQEVFDAAIDMSHHGGPCCCKCWKWYMMSGLAKKLIAAQDWNAEQVAQLWDLSSSCGHTEDTDMVQHYQHESH